MHAPFLVASGWCWLYWLGRAWGSSSAERRQPLPGDSLVRAADIATDHAIDIAATPKAIWPWLLQVGWGRGGWYTYRWVDRLLFPANAPSATGILPEFQSLAVGDSIPDGPPQSGCTFLVEEIEQARSLVLFSRSHLPPALNARPDVALAWSWSFQLNEIRPGLTRFHLRSRLALRPWWLRLAYRLALVPADFVMARSMCRGLRARAERGSNAATVQIADE